MTPLCLLALLKPRGCVRGGVGVVRLIGLAFLAAFGWVLDLGAEANQR
jgi:hypothetical protein